jgi:hypothetical protein
VKLQPGEIVDITIKGVRMVDDTHVHVTIADEHGHHYPMPPQAAIERVVPAAWPPRPGDLWRDRNGGLFFVMANLNGSPLMNGMDGGRHGHEYVLANYGPLSLVHREEQDEDGAQ